MADELRDPTAEATSFVRGGYSFRMASRMGFEPPNLSRRLTKVLLLILVTWVPLVILSVMRGHAWGRLVDEPLFFAPVVWSRFLFVVPLLELAQVVVERGLGTQVRHFLESGLVRNRDRPEFVAAHASALRLRGSVSAEVVIAGLALSLAVVARVFIAQGTDNSTWEKVGGVITPAGWWYILVSLPILFFFVLRWLWIFALWSWFLLRVSRLDLELTSTHPDRAGGLGFLGWGLAQFALVLMAISAVLSGSFAREILHRGSSLNSLKYHVVVFVVIAIAIIHLPLIPFIGKLARCRFGGLLAFGTLILQHDLAFEKKWFKSRENSRDSLLGSADVSSLADLGVAYEHVERMQIIPFDKKAVTVLVAALLIPMVPLVGTAIPLTEILSKLGELLV